MTVWFCPWTASSHRRVSAVVWTTENMAVAAAYRVDAQRWSELFGELMDTIEARFTRPEPRRRIRNFVAGFGGINGDRRWRDNVLGKPE